MMMRSVKRWVAIGLTAAVAAVGLEVATPVVAGATQVDLVCQGITGDNASSLGDSKATLGLLSTPRAWLDEHCRSAVAGYKVPRQLHLVDEIQRSPSGKPDYPWAKKLAEGGTNASD